MKGGGRRQAGGVKGSLKSVVRRSFGLCGLGLHRLGDEPWESLLGLRDAPFLSIIDVGANEGQFAARISAIFPEATLYCFEPLPQACATLTSWAGSRGERVKVFNAALGDREGTMEIFFHREHSPSSSFLRSTGACRELYPMTERQEPVPVAVRTLDSVMEGLLPREAAREILIKLDVQGYEAHVIRGGEKTFGRAGACIVEVSLDALYEGQPSFTDLAVMLGALGFAYAGNLEQACAPDGHVVFIDALFVRPAREGGDGGGR